MTTSGVRATKNLALSSLSLLVVACGGGAGEPTSAPARDEPALATAQPPSAVAAEDPQPTAPAGDVPAPEAPPVGWSTDLRVVPEAARAANVAALALHRAEDFAGSLAGFEAAIALAPDYLMARFNRACALSRLGRVDAAAEALRELLALDLTEFGPRLSTDDDLAALHASPAFAPLTAAHDALVEAYAAAAASGVPVTLYELEETDAGASRVTIPRRYRAGVFLPDSQRVVLLTPSVPNAFGLVFSRDSSNVTVLHGPLTSSMYELFPATFGVTVFSLTRPGAVVASAERLPATFRRLFPAVYRASVPDDDPTDWDMSFGGIRVRPLQDGVELQVQSLVGNTVMRLDVRGERPSVATEPRDTLPLHLVRVVQGVMGDSSLPAGFSLRGTSLTVPGRDEPVALGALHGWKQWEVDREHQALFVMAVRNGCEGRGHRLLRVDLATFEVRELSAARRGGALVRSGTGELYVQVDADVRRLSGAGELSEGGLPTWLKLTYPVPESDCTM